MTRRLLPALIAVAVATVVVPHAQQAPTVLTVRASVEDARGRFVPDLRDDDFEVRVDGAVQRIGIQPPGPEPLTLLLLVDMSFSHTLYRSPPGERAASQGHNFAWVVRGIERGLLDALTPADRLRLGRFAGRRIGLSEGFLTDRARHASMVRAFFDVSVVEPDDWLGPSPIWDAVATVARVLGPEPGPRALLLVTDGKSTANHLSMEDAAREAARHGVPVYVLYEREWAGAGFDRYHDADRLLQPLADWTGGVLRLDDSFARSGWTTPPPPFGPMIDALRASYTIRIHLDHHTPGTRELDVRVNREGLRVHAPRWVG
jgi:hypothetical protein